MKNGSQTIKRVLSMIMALAMIVTLLPTAAFAAESTMTLYLKPNANWKVDNARFAMYFFGNGETWVDMTDSDGDGIYEGTVPSGYPSVIFCRMNPSTTANNWTNRWNQTSDLGVPTDGTNCYTVAEGAWDKGSGAWSTYTTTDSSDPTETSEGDDEDDSGNTGSEEGETITVYFRNDWNWPTPRIHYWGSSTTSDTTWPGMAMTYVETDSVGHAIYSAEIPVNLKGIVFNGDKDDDSGTVQKTVDITDIQDGKCYYIIYDGDDTTETDNYGTFPYTPSTDEGGETDSTDPTTPTESVTNVTIHYRNTGLWSDVYYHAWIENGDNDSDLTTWPGTKVTEDTDHVNWYTVELTELDAANGIGVLFNNGGNGSQTSDIAITASGEYWYDGALLTEAPDSWADGSVSTVSYSASLHFANSMNWSNVNLYTWTATGTPTGAWPGSAVAQDSDGFYSMTVKYEAPEGQGLNFIFNGGSTQTADLVLDANAFTLTDGVYCAEKWVVPTTSYDDDGTTKYYADIVDNAESIAISPVVNDTSVTFAYKNTNASSVSVAGTFNEWNTTANLMTKNEYGVWSTTIENLSAGVHQYKFVVDGSWITDPLNSWIETEESGNQNSAFLISDPNNDTNKVTINIHYSRSDNDYEDWNAYVWTSEWSKQYDLDENHVATIQVDGRATQSVSFKMRKSVGTNLWVKEEGEVKVSLGNIVSGTIDVYTGNGSTSQKLGADIVYDNKISDIQLDYEKSTISITTSQAVSDPENAFTIVNTENTEDTTTLTLASSSGSTYVFTTGEDFDLVTLYQYKILFSEQKNQNYGDVQYDIGTDTVYATDKFADEYTYTTIGPELGATYTSESTTFKVWAPTAEAVSVKLYATGSDSEAGAEDKGFHAMTRGEKGVWSVTVEGDLNGTYYTYAATVDGETVEAVDPYARTTGVNGNRGMVIDLDSTDPADGWSEITNKPESYTDAVIYELHVRDFSIDDSSGVKDEWQGKFLGLTQSGTTSTDGETVTGLDYLKDLGITHLHLLPIYDYASVDESKLDEAQFNWGYDPQNYNTPEGSYSTDPYNGATRVKEMKEMVDTLHVSSWTWSTTMFTMPTPSASTTSFPATSPV